MDGEQGEPNKGFPTMEKLKKLPSLEDGGDGEGEEGDSFVAGGIRGMDKAGGGGEDEKKRRLSFTMGSYSSSSGNRRGSASGSQPCCQAEKCKVDLTDAKRYHRRHKVCEAHSKAPVVVVAGLQQRFCQQCSRFHELSEFDESKRSCRRRLAGHNERRRKVTSEPQGDDSSQCRQADQNGAAQINLSESTTFKHFQIR